MEHVTNVAMLYGCKARKLSFTCLELLVDHNMSRQEAWILVIEILTETLEIEGGFSFTRKSIYSSQICIFEACGIFYFSIRVHILVLKLLKGAVIHFLGEEILHH